MKAKAASILVLVAAVAPGTPHAATILECSSGPVKWQSNSPRFRASGISFPAGQAFTDALSNSIAQWNVNPSNFRFRLTFNDGSIDTDNGQSEVWFSSDADLLDGAPAVAFPWYDDCDEIVEKDIVFNVNVSWTSGATKAAMLSYSGTGRPFQTTANHEFGHGLGLQHENRVYNIMGDDWNVLSTNGSAARAYAGADASFGAVALYGLNTSVGPDISIVHWKWIGEDAGDPEYSAHGRTVIMEPAGAVAPSTMVSGEPRFGVPIGGSVLAEFTYENNGSTNITWLPVTFFISNNDTIDTSDRIVGSAVLNNLWRGDAWTTTSRIWLPSDLVQGQTYYLGAIADIVGGGYISEFNENNNATYTAIRARLSRPVALVLTPSYVPRGDTAIGRVTLDGVAPAGGVTVALTSSDPNVATVPTTVAVPAGSYLSAAFEVTTGGDGICRTDLADITAIRGGGSATASLVVLPTESQGELCFGKFDWGSNWDRPFACFAIEPDFGGPPGRAGTLVGKCAPPPSCPECRYGLGGDAVTVLPYLSELYLNVFNLTLATPPDEASRIIKGTRALLAGAPSGRTYTNELRGRLIRTMDTADRRTPELLRASVEGLNALELDVRAPALAAIELNGPVATATLNGVMRVTANGVSRPGKLSLALRAGLPASFEGSTPVWPIFTYDLEFGGELAREGSLEMAINMRGLDLEAPLASVRAFEWDGKAYRDITTHVDEQQLVIHAETTKPHTLLVLMHPARVSSDPQVRSLAVQE